MPGIASENIDQKAGHLLYLKRKGEYIHAQDEEYGDWSYIGGSTLNMIDVWKAQRIDTVL